MKIKKVVSFALILIFAALAVYSTTSASWAMVGVNISGSEYSWATYPIASHLDYLKNRGVILIRLPIAWEKLQPTLNGPLSATEIANLQAFLTLAASRDMQVIIDIHNYARYDINWAADAAANGGCIGSGDAKETGLVVLGTSDLPISAFQNLWTKLAGALAGHAGLAGYDIMNEPHDLGAGVWPSAAQAAVDGIRSVDMNTTIYVEGTQWASAYYWFRDNGSLKINDPANKVVYEAHLYFDGGSTYSQTYDQLGAYPTIGVDQVQPFLQWLRQNNARGFIGEFAVPENDPLWLTIMDNFLNALNQNNVPSTYWYYTYADPSGRYLWWPLMTGTVFSISLVPYINGQDKPQWGIISKYNLGSPVNLRLVVP